MRVVLSDEAPDIAPAGVQDAPDYIRVVCAVFGDVFYVCSHTVNEPHPDTE